MRLYKQINNSSIFREDSLGIIICKQKWKQLNRKLLLCYGQELELEFQLTDHSDAVYYLSNQDVATQRFPTRQIDCIYISLK